MNKPLNIYETMCLLENDPKSMSFIVCESTGGGRDDCNRNIFIKVSYLNCSNAKELSTVMADNQKVKVDGYVSNGLFEEAAYIVGRTIVS